MQITTPPIRFGTQPSSAGQPSHPVVTPPSYDPQLMAHNLTGQQRADCLQHFTRYQQARPGMVLTAQSLANLLSQNRAPSATLYPMPHPYAMETITLMLPLPPGATDAIRKQLAEPHRQQLLAVLQGLSPQVTPTVQPEIFTYTPQPGSLFQLAVMVEPTETEALAMETFH